MDLKCLICILLIGTYVNGQIPDLKQINGSLIAKVTKATLKTDAAKLYEELTTNYHTTLKPLVKDGQLTVRVGFTLSRIEKLDERSQTLVTYGYLNLQWRDELMVWNPADYGGIDHLVLHPDKLWLPEIELLNSVEQVEDIALSENMRFRATVTHTGMVSWTPAVKFNTYCPLNLEFFPFDSQVCGISIINWTYKSNSVNLTLLSDKVRTPTNLQRWNIEWTLDNATLERHDYQLDSERNGTDENVPVVTMLLTMTRHPVHYLLNVLLPTIIIAQISILVYLISPQSGEKISFSITVLLSYFVILLIVSEIMPRSGSTVPYLTIYITMCMMLTALSLIMTVLMLNIYHHHPYKRVPLPVRKLFFNCLANLLCLNTSAYKTSSVNRKKARAVHMDANGDMTLDTTLNTTGKSASSVDLPKDSVSEVDGENNNVDATVRASNILVELEEEKEIIELNRQEWQLLARVIDRLFLILSLVFITGLTVIFFVVVKLSATSINELGDFITGLVTTI